ncbi:MAG: D-2-hydroxyacid dehydrogenase [Acidobacteriota bacterium]
MLHRLLLVAIGCTLAAAGQPKKILLTIDDPSLLQQFQRVTPLARIVPVTRATLITEIADADAVIGSVSPAAVRAARRLKWVQALSAGVEHLLFPDLRDSAIVLTNNKIVQGPEIADHAMALLLTLSRRLNLLAAKQAQGEWDRSDYTGIELNGKTAVIVGVGGIGTQIAVRASAFGMRVIGVDPEDRPYLPSIARMVKPDQLDTVLPEADVVFIAAPHTPQSRKMIGTRQFELMKPHSYFIAVSRGALYDMDGLVHALDGKRLDGAGVDVTDPEPLPKGHPLWKFENAIVTPHIAGQSDQVGARLAATVEENIRRFVEGKPLINVVDKQKGY